MCTWPDLIVHLNKRVFKHKSDRPLCTYGLSTFYPYTYTTYNIHIQYVYVTKYILSLCIQPLGDAAKIIEDPKVRHTVDSSKSLNISNSSNPINPSRKYREPPWAEYYM